MLILASIPATAGDLNAIDSWAFWLADIVPAKVAASPFDMLVVDYSSDGSAHGAFSRSQVEQMKRRPAGGSRTLIGYLSIGEAEDYRYYWNPWWKLFHPPWLDRENPDWKGNYKVKYWLPAWQRIIFGSPDSYLDRIIAAGFDGVLLDVVDAFEYFEPTHPDAAELMIDFITSISDYAKARKPGFLIIPQNGELLASHPRYIDVIDGIEKEDLFYGLAGDGIRNSEEDIAYSSALLDRIKEAGKPVFTVDYGTDPAMIRSAYALSQSHGYKPYVTIRPLDSLSIHSAR